jgi:hypothetical protein
VGIHLAAEGFDVEIFHCCLYCTGIAAGCEKNAKKIQARKGWPPMNTDERRLKAKVLAVSESAFIGVYRRPRIL